MERPDQRPLRRRTVLRGAFGIVAGAALAGILAACGDDEPGETDALIASAAGNGESAPDGTSRPLFDDAALATVTPAPTLEPTVTSVPSATATPEPRPLTIVTDWDEALVADFASRFSTETGVEVVARTPGDGSLVELAASDADADVYLARSLRELAGLEAAELLAPLPEELLAGVDAPFTSVAGRWVGVGGRSTVLLYDAGRVASEDLPATLLDFTAPRWRSAFGFAPATAHFEMLMLALVSTAGVDAAESWAQRFAGNRPAHYASTLDVARAVATGEVLLGIAQHTDIFALEPEYGAPAPLGAQWLGGGADDAAEPGAFVDLRGAAIADQAHDPDASAAFIQFLLSGEAQAHLVALNGEYPLVAGVAADSRLPLLSQRVLPQLQLADPVAVETAKLLAQQLAPPES